MKRNRRKNPVNDVYIKLLCDAIIYGVEFSLVQAIVYYKQGYACEDCEEDYSFCECENAKIVNYVDVYVI